MTMHLLPAMYSTTGKKKGKKKFRNAEEARKARELEESWKNLTSKYQSNKKIPKNVKPLEEPKPYIRQTEKIKSLGNGIGAATKSEPMKYTGTLIKGIATMHKSNAVPVINDEQAIEISRMRR